MDLWHMFIEILTIEVTKITEKRKATTRGPQMFSLCTLCPLS
jgi:hypothetical protein